MTATAAPRSWKIDLTVAPPQGVQLAPVTGGTGKRRYPIYNLEVGHSFKTTLPPSGSERRAIFCRINAAISQCSRATGKKFATHATPSGLRVWRTA
jgi:hypothetical protein